MHARPHVRQGTPFIVCLLSVSAHVSTRVCTWASQWCVCTRSCAYLGPVHISPCLEGTNAATSPTKRDCHRASLGAGAGVARSAPWLQQLRPLLSLDAPRVPQGRAAFPFSAVVPGAEERGRDSHLPVASRDQAVSVCRPGRKLLGRACRMWPFPSKSQDCQDPSFTPPERTWALTAQPTWPRTRGRPLLGARLLAVRRGAPLPPEASLAQRKHQHWGLARERRSPSQAPSQAEAPSAVW